MEQIRKKQSKALETFFRQCVIIFDLASLVEDPDVIKVQNGGFASKMVWQITVYVPKVPHCFCNYRYSLVKTRRTIYFLTLKSFEKFYLCSRSVTTQVDQDRSNAYQLMRVEETITQSIYLYLISIKSVFPITLYNWYTSCTLWHSYEKVFSQ